MKTIHDLTPSQRMLLDEVEQYDGDGADYLRAHPAATNEDKAAVAEVQGGPDDAREFQQ